MKVNYRVNWRDLRHCLDIYILKFFPCGLKILVGSIKLKRVPYSENSSDLGGKLMVSPDR